MSTSKEWNDQLFLRCAGCGVLYTYLVIGGGRDRDVTFPYGGKNIRVCKCGNNLVDQWWQEQLITWKQSTGGVRDVVSDQV